MKRKIAYFVTEAVCAGGALIVIALIIRELGPCKDKDSSDCDSGEDRPKSTDEKGAEKKLLLIGLCN